MKLSWSARVEATDQRSKVGEQVARIESQKLEPEILRVLAQASCGKGTESGFLTAYQILKRLPEALQLELLDAYGPSGKEAGVHFGGASRVAQVADEAQGVEKKYLDTGGLQFDVGEPAEVQGGYSLCAIFRLRPLGHP